MAGLPLAILVGLAAGLLTIKNKRKRQDPPLPFGSPVANKSTHVEDNKDSEPEEAPKVAETPAIDVFKEEFSKHVVDWATIDVDLDQFPYYLSERSKELLLNSAHAHLKRAALAKYTLYFQNLSNWILLSGPEGSQVYQEQLVRALARKMHAKFLAIDSEAFIPSEVLDALGGFRKRHTLPKARGGGGGGAGGDSVGTGAAAGAAGGAAQDGVENMLYNTIARQLVALATLMAAGVAAGALTGSGSGGASTSQQQQQQQQHNSRAFDSPSAASFAASSTAPPGGAPADSQDKEGAAGTGGGGGGGGGDDSGEKYAAAGDSAAVGGGVGGEPPYGRSLRLGDRVAYVNVDGYSTDVAVPSRPPKGATGLVVATYEAVGVRFDAPVPGGHSLSGLCDSGHGHICYASELQLEGTGAGTGADHAELLALGEVLEAELEGGPLIVFIREADQFGDFPASGLAFKDELADLSGPIIFVGSCVEFEGDQDADHMDADVASLADAICELFPNRITVQAPKEIPLLDVWERQMERDAEVLQARKNRRALEDVMRWTKTRCDELDAVTISDLVLSSDDAEDILGWATGHYMRHASCPEERDGQLIISLESMNYGVGMLRALQEDLPAVAKSSPEIQEIGGEKAGKGPDRQLLSAKRLKRVTTSNKFEERILAEVVPAGEVGVCFDEIGALEAVKDALRELVMLPLQRPELFARGALTRPCRGILLFGPPGTGKTMLAKAVATDAGANFINISLSSILSKWLGEAEKSVRAVFAVASKIAPTVIFIDEVDSLLGRRGEYGEHDTMRKVKNEFMACWDGLRTKAHERVLVLAATNRPFDLDEAIVRRFPRRLMVGLPDAGNREKVLRVILQHELLEDAFDFAQLAAITEGYSGSDLKNLCVAAAYQPIRELLEKEKEEKAAAAAAVAAAGARVKEEEQETLRVESEGEAAQEQLAQKAPLHAEVVATAAPAAARQEESSQKEEEEQHLQHQEQQEQQKEEEGKENPAVDVVPFAPLTGQELQQQLQLQKEEEGATAGCAGAGLESVGSQQERWESTATTSRAEEEAGKERADVVGGRGVEGAKEEAGGKSGRPLAHSAHVAQAGSGSEAGGETGAPTAVQGATPPAERVEGGVVGLEEAEEAKGEELRQSGPGAAAAAVEVAVPGAGTSLEGSQEVEEKEEEKHVPAPAAEAAAAATSAAAASAAPLSSPSDKEEGEVVREEGGAAMAAPGEQEEEVERKKKDKGEHGGAVSGLASQETEGEGSSEKGEQRSAPASHEAQVADGGASASSGSDSSRGRSGSPARASAGGSREAGDGAGGEHPSAGAGSLLTTAEKTPSSHLGDAASAAAAAAIPAHLAATPAADAGGSGGGGDGAGGIASGEQEQGGRAEEEEKEEHGKGEEEGETHGAQPALMAGASHDGSGGAGVGVEQVHGDSSKGCGSGSGSGSGSSSGSRSGSDHAALGEGQAQVQGQGQSEGEGGESHARDLGGGGSVSGAEVIARERSEQVNGVGETSSSGAQAAAAGGDAVEELRSAAASSAPPGSLQAERTVARVGPVLRPLTMDDMRKAKEQVSASTSMGAAAMAELRQWNELYGEGGSRQKETLSYFL